MSRFPNFIDDDSDIPSVYNNITEIGGDAINALKDAVINIENNLGINAQGSALSVSQRLGVSLQSDGYIKPSALLGLGLVTLPITDAQISPTAGILESKLHLDHATQDLFNAIALTNVNLNIALNWISLTGVKVEPHINGSAFRHNLTHIDTAPSPSKYFKNKYGLLRNNTDAYTLFNDINSDLIQHQRADGGLNINGSLPPSNNYAHISSGIYLNPGLFSFIPQTIQDLQSFAEFIDNSNIFLYGTRIQNFYSNGISKTSRSSSLVNDGYGVPVIPVTKITSYFLQGANCAAENPVDDIYTGDDIIEFFPTTSNYIFDSQFYNIRIGDIITVNYGTIETKFVIKEKKYLGARFIVRINGKNIQATSNGTARIDRPLFNRDKYGVLSLAAANNGILPSLIVGSPRGASAIGSNFDPEELDSSHYNLYLELYPTGNPADGVVTMPAIDVTGNAGTTPGKYTLQSIIEATNNAFRQDNYNYRFIAFQYEGQFGIMLADSYGGAGFSILAGVSDGYGLYTTTYTNNVIDDRSNIGIYKDPLGFGTTKAKYAGPAYRSFFTSKDDISLVTRVNVPLKRNTFYVNGIERERLANEYLTSLDVNGDGYWAATIASTPNPGEVMYNVDLNLSRSKLAPGKTLVIQSSGIGGTIGDFGRFAIKSVNFGACDGYPTSIIVQNAVHALGSKSAAGTKVKLYFSDDSIGFNKQNSSDFDLRDEFNNIIPTNSLNFKKYFEIYIDQNGKTFSHERARFWNAAGSSYIKVNGTRIYYDGSFQNLQILNVSPKLRGYPDTSTLTGALPALNKISLYILSTDGINFDGYLGNHGYIPIPGMIYPGPTISGKKGEVVRFYDQTNIDYIDILIDINDTNLTADTAIDIQLSPTLQLDEELMLLGTCQVDDANNKISYLNDKREFGNISEEQFSNSAINFITAGDKYFHQNGVIKGFDIISSNIFNNNFAISIQGGSTLTNGKIININNQNINAPFVNEYYSSTDYTIINWALCVNDKNELIFIPLTDTFDARPTNRIVSLKEPVTSYIYKVDSNSFSKIITSRKDLTILYIVQSDTNANSLTVTDARKFVNDSTGVITATVTDDKFQGNFQSLEAAKSWITYNKLYNSKIILKGNHSINNDINLSFDHPVIIDGEKIANLNINSNLTLGNVTVQNCNIAINVKKGFILNNNVNLNNNIINYNCPDSSSDENFDSKSYTNPKQAAVYIPVLDTKNININNNIFNCTFDVVTQNRFPFVSFDFNQYSNAYLYNVNIENNYFNDYFVSADGDKYTSVICFVVTSTISNVIDNNHIINTNIKGNICNKNQQICIGALYTTPTQTSYPTFSPSLLNVFIENNICGTIIYANKNLTPSNLFNSSTSTTITDKQNALFIKNNNCRLISVGNGTGRYNFFDPNDNSSLKGISPSGTVYIENNICSWIIAESPDTNANVKISSNTLTGYDTTFLLSFGDYFTGAINNYAILVNNSARNKGNAIISENNISVGVYFSNHYYSKGIVTFGNAHILNNYVSGLFNDTSTIGIDISGVNLGADSNYVVAKGNNIIRDTSSIKAYISSSGQYTAQALVTDNYFDSITLDGTNQPFLENLIPTNWIYTQNKNQIGVSALMPSFNSLEVLDETVYNRSGDTWNYASDSLQIAYQNSVPSSSLKPVKIYIGDSWAGPAYKLRDIRFNTNLNSAIPIGARILTVQVAVYLDFGDFRFFEITNQPPQDYIAPEFSLGLDLTGASAQQFLYLKTLQTNISNKNNLSLRFNGDYNALKTNPQIITLDVSSNSYINNSLPMINACLRVKYQTLLNAASPPIIWVSPMVVTYQW